MNKPIKHLGILLVMCYLAIFVKLHQTQLLEVQELSQQPENRRETQRKLNQPRGKIASADGAELAYSVNVAGPRTPRERKYPEGDLFGHITGYYSGLFGTDIGVEKTYNEILMGESLRQQFDGLTNLFAQRENVGNVTVTLRKDLQQVAREALGDKQGAVTVIDPRTGAILAMWSNPSFDPVALTVTRERSVEDAQAAFNAYNTDPGKPMLNKAYRERYNPGSTFKAVTAGVGLESGKVTVNDPVYPVKEFLTFPDFTGQIFNFGRSACGGALPQIMTVSCNTSFMQMGLDEGLPTLSSGAQKFGWLQDVKIDLPGPVKSSIPTPEGERIGQAGLAQTSIGQQNNVATPLQIALVAAAAANSGVIMEPHVLANVRNADGTVVNEFKPREWLRPMSAANADTLRQVLLGPVNNAGGSAAGRIRLPAGMQAGGKTGTAQTGDGNAPVHTWFMGYAGPTGGVPTVAVSVVVLRQPNNGEATGGQVAAPIANSVLNKAVEVADQPTADNTALFLTKNTPTPPAGPGETTTTTR